MNTVWLERSSNDHPFGDSSTDTPHETLLRARPPSARTLPAPDTDHDDESPIMRLVRTHDRTNTRTPAASESEQLPRLPVTVLTTETTFANQLRAAFDGHQDVCIIATADEAAALAVSGRCPILITDAVLTRSALEALSARLRSHDSAAAIVVAGTRDQGGMLASLQSAGVVDGFLLKPATAAATQIVVEAAARRYRNGGDRTAAAPNARGRTSRHAKSPSIAQERLQTTQTVEVQRTPPCEQLAPLVPVRSSSPVLAPSTRPSWAVVTVLVAVFVALAAAGATWFAAQRPAAIDANSIVAEHLSLAESALQAGRLLQARDGAARHFHTVLAIEPDNFAALRGLDAVANALSRETQQHMSAERLPEAAISLERLRDFQPAYAELPLLESQLQALQERLVAAHRQPPVTEAPAGAPKPAPPVRREARTTVPAERTLTEPILTKAAEGPDRAAVENRELRATPARDGGPPVEAATESNLVQTATSSTSATNAPASPDATRTEDERIDRPSDTRTASIGPAPMRRVTNPATVAPGALNSPPPSPASDPPPLLKYMPPTYPAEALNRRMEGWIEISMEIAPNGAVLHPHIEAGEKRQLFGRAALTAVKQWKYVPDATRPAGKRSNVRLEFKLE